MKLSLTIALLTITFSSASQPYQSLFGQNSTQWVFEWANLFGTFQDTIFVEKDTLVDGETWKKLAGSRENIFGYYKGGIIREDTITGKVWYRDINHFDTVTKLAFDFSLQQGDYFDTRMVWGNPPDSMKIVDTVYYLAGSKVIVTKTFLPKFYEYFTFVEGVGSNLGIIYKQYSGLVLAHYLLCSYKDGVKTYSNTYYNGNCAIHPISSVIDVTDASQIRIYPNPVHSILHIRNQSDTRFDHIRILDFAGAVVYRGAFNEVVNVQRLPAGIYVLQLFTKKGSLFKSVFFKN